MATKLFNNVTANGNSQIVQVGEGHGGTYLLQTKATSYDSGVVLPQISPDRTNWLAALSPIDGAAVTGLGADGRILFVVPGGFYYRLNLASIVTAAVALNAWVGKVR